MDFDLAAVISKIVLEGKYHNRNNWIAQRLPKQADYVTKI